MLLTQGELATLGKAKAKAEKVKILKKTDLDKAYIEVMTDKPKTVNDLMRIFDINRNSAYWRVQRLIKNGWIKTKRQEKGVLIEYYAETVT